jgi:hypothetical protein
MGLIPSTHAQIGKNLKLLLSRIYQRTWTKIDNVLKTHLRGNVWPSDYFCDILVVNFGKWFTTVMHVLH